MINTTPYNRGVNIYSSSHLGLIFLSKVRKLSTGAKSPTAKGPAVMS